MENNGNQNDLVPVPQNQGQRTYSNGFLTVSDNGIAKASKYLTSDEKPTKHTPLLPLHVCHAVIARHSNIGPAMPESDARKATVVLLAGYPGAFTADPSERLPYMAKIMGVFCLYPSWAVQKVIAPGFKFAGGVSFKPNDKEVAEALDLVVSEYRAFAVRAWRHKEECHRRDAEAAREAQINAEKSRHTPEQRAAMASAIIAKAFQTIDQEVIA